MKNAFREEAEKEHNLYSMEKAHWVLVLMLNFNELCFNEEQQNNSTLYRIKEAKNA